MEGAADGNGAVLNGAGPGEGTVPAHIGDDGAVARRSNTRLRRMNAWAVPPTQGTRNHVHAATVSCQLPGVSTPAPTKGTRAANMAK
ncbi:hypothetical protein GCM10023193_22640 [Planotetraspora kaengkrachanensis]|uniref:Uncharacterized protein n=1 Tax=Planotetraspora kaengkrachanensis TaxID=575193 RepID=A0A8J3LY62_9ACTN|nr:hypothetical protein Pka01_31510 [Planotetraspora kaengkrachanensis]